MVFPPEVDAPPLPSVLAPPGAGGGGTGSKKPTAAAATAGGDVLTAQQEMPPVDEDDYLQPKSSHPAPYMDIIPDSRGAKLCYTTSV